MNFFTKGLRSMTFLLDRGIYSIVKVAYSVFYYLSDATLLNHTENITLRIYTILSIVMVFVLAFNLLNYIVDPDKINDKKIGASAFIKDVIIALVIISMTPMLFTKLYSLQSEIINSGVISNLILGGNAGNEGVPNSEDYEANQDLYKSLSDYYVQHGADSMIASVYVAFLYPEDGFTVLKCTPANQEEQADYEAHKEYCDNYKKVKSGSSLMAFNDYITNADYNFTPFLSTAAGLVLLFFMLMFCIELGKRVGKLAIIQLIAPIPVTLELLPNKKGLRKNWLETLAKVYLEVFIYQLIMYLIIFMIALIPDVVGRIVFMDSDGGGLVKIFTIVFLTFGLLMFAKDAPQMLCDLLGIKGTGTITNAIKNFKPAAGAAAFLGGTAGSMFGNALRNYNATDGNVLQKLASGVGGASSTFFRSAWGARNVHSVRDANNLRQNVNRTVVQNRVNRDAYAHAHPGRMGSTRGHIADAGRNIERNVRNYTGVAGAYENTKHTEQVLRDYKKLYQEAVESLWKNDSQWSSADADFKRYDNMIKSGAVRGTDIDHATGLSYDDLRLRAKTMRDARQGEVLKVKKLQFMEAAGKLNNFIDANQGVTGITTQHINLEDIASISSAADADVQLDALRNLVEDDGHGTGFKQNLKNIESDAQYQQERVREKLREDARQARQNAANQASNGNNNNNNR